MKSFSDETAEQSAVGRGGIPALMSLPSLTEYPMPQFIPERNLAQTEPTAISTSDEIFQIGNRLREILQDESSSIDSADLNHLIGTFPDLILLALKKDHFLPALEDDFRRSFSDFHVQDWREMFAPIKPFAMAQLITSLPLVEPDRDKPNRALALAVADAMTADEAQELYRFAVLVTKLV